LKDLMAARSAIRYRAGLHPAGSSELAGTLRKVTLYMPLKANVGDVVDSQCGVCHDTTKHEVLEVNDKGHARKCRCLVEECGAEHLWRKPKGKEPVKPKRDKEREARERKRQQYVAEYQRLLEESQAQEPTVYGISKMYEVGERLDHKKFGPGVVTEIVAPKVIEVMFEEGTRRLAMGR
jgi:hypothetical protein